LNITDDDLLDTPAAPLPVPEFNPNQITVSIPNLYNNAPATVSTVSLQNGFKIDFPMPTCAPTPLTPTISNGKSQLKGKVLF